MTKRQMTLSWHGPLVAGAAAALVFAAGGAAQAAPTTEKTNAADVAVELNADPPFAPVDRGTRITATVRNQGGRPARDLRLEVTAPSAFQVSGWNADPSWTCATSGQVVTCEGNADLAAHTTASPIDVGLVSAAEAGTVADVSASVTTSSSESDTSNNTASRTVQIVGIGTVQGNVWHDLDGDGQREPGEPPLDDIHTIELLNLEDDGGQIIVNIFDGFYSFTDEPATRHIIRVTLNPTTSPWTFTTPNVGDDATDSDVVKVSETQALITGDSPEFNVITGGVVTVDIGLVARSQ